MASSDPPLDGVLARFEARRRALLNDARARSADLPLRLLRQSSHFTTPASDPERVRKAATGLAPARRLLERQGLSVEEVAGAIEVEPAVVQALVEAGAPPPLVLVDAEDAVAEDPAVAARARTIAADALAGRGEALAFYRPAGLELDGCVRDLVEVIGGVAARRAGDAWPLDGVIWPKARHEDEVRFLDELLAELEGAAGIASGTIRVGLLIESGAAVLRLPWLVDAARPRLCSLIIGTADYSSDLGLPRLAHDHPTCDHARRAIVDAAAAAGVPAIDGMTLEYPVADPALDAAANRARILGALAACARDARHGLGLGMQGKWVGHPLQLLVNEAVRRAAIDPAQVKADVASALAYAAAVAAGEGTVMLEGRMVDRAFDRHVRERLRRALATGALDAATAAALRLA